jgi:hypothetical protein
MKCLEQKVEQNENHKPAFQLKIGHAFQHIPKKSKLVLEIEINLRRNLLVHNTHTRQKKH